MAAGTESTERLFESCDNGNVADVLDLINSLSDRGEYRAAFVEAALRLFEQVGLSGQSGSGRRNKKGAVPETFVRGFAKLLQGQQNLRFLAVLAKQQEANAILPALEEYEQILRVHGDGLPPVSAYEYASICLMRARRFAQASEIVERIVRRWDGSPQVLLVKATQACFEGDFEGCADLVDRVLRSVVGLVPVELRNVMGRVWELQAVYNARFTGESRVTGVFERLTSSLHPMWSVEQSMSRSVLRDEGDLDVRLWHVTCENALVRWAAQKSPKTVAVQCYAYVTPETDRLAADGELFRDTDLSVVDFVSTSADIKLSASTERILVRGAWWSTPSTDKSILDLTGSHMLESTLAGLPLALSARIRERVGSASSYSVV